MAPPRPLLALALAMAFAGCGDDEARDARYDLTTPGPRIGAEALPGTLPEVTPTPAAGATPREPRPLRGEFRPTQADAERLRPVLAGWADALRRSDAAAAARFFRVPAVIAQPTTQPRELRTPDEVLAFNASLPCGAQLLEVQHDGRFVVGTFRLTERPGSTCANTGDLVRVAFVIRRRRFTEWYQVADARGAVPGPEERPKFDDSGRVTG